MSLRRAYELGLTLATSVSLLMVLLGGELPLGAWVAVAVPSISAGLESREVRLPGAVGTVIGLGAFLYGISMVVLSGLAALVQAGGLTLASVLVARLLTRRSLLHDLQAMLISLLLVFAATVLHPQITYGPLFVVYAVVAVWALVARQLVVGAQKEAARVGGAAVTTTLSRRDIVTPAFLAVTAGIALILLVSSSVLFILFPRFGIGSFGFMRSQRGDLPADVSLVGAARAGMGGGEVVARVRGVPYAAFERGLYLRGPIYDTLARTGFSQATKPPILPLDQTRLAPAQMRGEYEVFMQPVAGWRLLTLGMVERAYVVAGGTANPSQRVRLIRTGRQDELLASRMLSGPIRYWVSGSMLGPGWVGAIASVENDLPAEMSYFLRLPQDLDPRIRDLAQRIAGSRETLAERAAAIRRYLLENHTYDLELPNSSKPDPLAGFLFEQRRGHCEYFATAQAVMLRSVGVPTRVVGGFQGGKWDDVGNVAVFFSGNAHVWVEWFQPGVGWVPDDATPEIPRLHFAGLSAWLERMSRRWDEYVVEYGLTHQIAIVQRIAGAASGGSASRADKASGRAHTGLRVVVVLGLVTLAAWLVWRRMRQVAIAREHLLGVAIQRAIERLSGAPVPDARTMRTAVDTCLSDTPSARYRSVLSAALQVYEAERFGERPVDPERHKVLSKALARLRPARAIHSDAQEGPQALS